MSDLTMEDNISTLSVTDFDDEHVYHHYEDDYSEDEVFDNEDDNKSEDTHESYIMVGKKNKKIKKKKKVKHDNQDKGLRKIKTGDGKNMVYFATNMIPGSSIRDAVYGTFMHEDKVGSNDEDLYFKVAYAAHGSKDTIDKLFYDNPEQFENHMKTNVSDVLKREWAETYRLALERKKIKNEKLNYVNNIEIR